MHQKRHAARHSTYGLIGPPLHDVTHTCTRMLIILSRIGELGTMNARVTHFNTAAGRRLKFPIQHKSSCRRFDMYPHIKIFLPES